MFNTRNRMPSYYGSQAPVNQNPGQIEPQNPGVNNYATSQPGANIIPGTNPQNAPQFTQDRRNDQRNTGNNVPQPTQNPNQPPRNNGGGNNVPPQNFQQPQNPPTGKQAGGKGPNQQPPQNPNGRPQNNWNNNTPPQPQQPFPQNPKRGQQGNWANGNHTPQNEYQEAPDQQCPEKAGNDEPPVETQIYRIWATNKVVDFHSNLAVAQVKDYAKLHSRGGVNSPTKKSTIVVNICSYTKDKTGNTEQSETLSYSMEWQDVELFLDRAIKAENGELYPPFGQQPSPGRPWQCYCFEKNQAAYKSYIVGKGENAVTWASVNKIEINYTPIDKNGQFTSYPWYIAITTFDAPVDKQKNGTFTHRSAEARKVQKQYICVSATEFRRAMVTISHHIRSWENAMTLKTTRDGAYLAAQYRASKSQTKKNK